jgi:hypothetical protein
VTKLPDLNKTSKKTKKEVNTGKTFLFDEKVLINPVLEAEV